MTTSQLFWYGLGRIVFVLVVVVLVFAPIVLVAERRQSAMIQDRLGPSRADVTIFGVKFTLGGLLHSMADALKMIFKEDFVPPNADKFLHSIAPIIALIPTLATFAVIPFGDVMYLDHLGEFLPREGVPGAITMPLQIASVNVGILFSFAIAGTGIIGAAIGGYASDNKFSLLGGLRAASQMVSYEVALGLTLVPCFMMYSSLRLEDMARFQAEHAWGIFYPPHGRRDPLLHRRHRRDEARPLRRARGRARSSPATSPSTPASSSACSTWASSSRWSRSPASPP